MNKKKVIVSLLIIVFILLLGVYFYTFSLNKKENTKDPNIKSNSEEQNSSGKKLTGTGENDCYSIYIKSGSNPGISFVPLSLNPGLEAGSDYNISTSIDDNGEVISDEKVIVIENYVISDENKEMIKKIAGDNYEAALKEIQDEIETVKGDY